MTEITEGYLTFAFPSSCQASKYDDWSFYRNQFQSVAGGSKAVDILCVDGNTKTSWLIEIKDYRQHTRTKRINIADELVIKVRDTLVGLAAAAKNANDAGQKELAQKALATKTWRVVLHLEQPATMEKLWPKANYPANLLRKLKSKKLEAIDAHPIVCDRSTIHDSIHDPPIPWSVRSEPFNNV